MSNLLEELRQRHALAVHDRDAINVQISHLTERLQGAYSAIWELERACRALESSNALSGAIGAPEAMEIADEPVALTEPPSEPQEDPLVEAIAAIKAVNATIKEIAESEGVWINELTEADIKAEIEALKAAS